MRRDDEVIKNWKMRQAKYSSSQRKRDKDSKKFPFTRSSSFLSQLFSTSNQHNHHFVTFLVY